jgi:hypothetical protein
MNISDFKKMSPAYSDISDGDLAYRLWNSKYKDKIPMGVFADKIELSKEGFTEMISVAQTSGYEPTGSTFAEEYVPEGSTYRAMLEGRVLGFGGEVVAGGTALAQKAMGDERPIGDIYEGRLEREESLLDQYRKAAPLNAAINELEGGFTSPAMLVTGPAALAKMGPLARGAAGGATTGAVYGAGSAQPGERMEGAVEGAAIGAAAGGIGQKIFDRPKTVVKSLSDSMKNPTIENLEKTKRLAYEYVDQSGELFGVDDIQKIYDKAVQIGTELDIMPDTDRLTVGAFESIKKRLGSAQTLTQLDNLRKNLWKRSSGLSVQGHEKTAIRRMIDAIDDTIDAKADASSVMRTARLANSRFKKAETLDKVFRNADIDIAAAAGSMDELSKYRKAVASIMKSDSKSKWFSDNEKKAMLDFIDGRTSHKVLDKLARLAPKSGFEWMLHLTAGYVASPLSAATVAGVAAKRGLGKRATQEADQLVNLMGDVKPPAARPNIGPAAGIMGNILSN